MKTGPASFWMTFPDRKTAEAILAKLVDENLLACANIIDQIYSIYKWENNIKSSSECAALAKGLMEQLPALEKRLLELHPFKVPCLTAWPLSGGASAYLDWLAKSNSATTGQ